MKKLVSILCLVLMVSSTFNLFSQGKLNKKVLEYSASLENEFNQIPEAHRKSLEELGNYLFTKTQGDKDINVLLISRHNSRRSHMGQLWLMTAAEYYGIQDVHIFSGGIEPTELDSRVIRALKKCGFKVAGSSRTANPTYVISNGSGNSYMVFAKQYNGRENPSSNFVAVVLSEVANNTLETVPGADKKIPVLYQDLEHFDDTPEEEQKYDEGCRQIARDMFYVMHYVRKLNI